MCLLIKIVSNYRSDLNFNSIYRQYFQKGSNTWDTIIIPEVIGGQKIVPIK